MKFVKTETSLLRTDFCYTGCSYARFIKRENSKNIPELARFFPLDVSNTEEEKE